MPDDNVFKFHSAFSKDSSVFGEILFQWSVVGKKNEKRMGPKKWVTNINLSHALD